MKIAGYVLRTTVEPLEMIGKRRVMNHPKHPLHETFIQQQCLQSDASIDGL